MKRFIKPKRAVEALREDRMLGESMIPGVLLVPRWWSFDLGGLPLSAQHGLANCPGTRVAGCAIQYSRTR